MELKLEAKSDRYWILELVGEDHTLPNLLRENLLRQEDVEFASYVVEHPVISHPKLIIRTRKKTAREALKKALEAARDQLEELRGQLRKVREKK